jgi:hypothetical protein
MTPSIISEKLLNASATADPVACGIKYLDETEITGVLPEFDQDAPAAG